MTAFRGKSIATAVHSNKGISSRSFQHQMGKVLATGGTIALLATGAQAEQFSFNEVYGSLDTKLSWGSIFRTQGQELDGDNTNDGNYNFDPGLASNVFKATADLQVNFKQYGFFTRSTIWYDTVIMDGSTDGLSNVADGQANTLSGERILPAVKEKSGSSLEFLDVYFYMDFDFMNRPISARLGRQVINWGEGLFFRDGINTINPADLSKLRLPGSEVKEALIPLNALYFNVGVTDTISAEAYYQFEWKSSEVEPVGTFFSTTDIFGTGASRAIASLEGSGLQQLLDIIDSTGEAGTLILNGLYDEDIQYGSAGNSFSANSYYVQVASRIMDDSPKEDGQYGFAIRYIADWLNSTEFAGYFVNYHSHVPRIGAVLGGANAVTDATAFEGVELGGIDIFTAIGGANVLNYLNSTKYFAVYPEDIRMFGFSFNTVVGETSVAGEIAHRPNMPLFTVYEDNLLAANIIDLAIPLANNSPTDVDAYGQLSIDAARELAANGPTDPLDMSADLEAQGIPDLSTFGFGSELLDGTLEAGLRVDAWDRKPVTNGSILTIHSFGPLPFLKLDNLLNITEIGFSHVGGLSSEDRFRSGEGNYVLSYSEAYEAEVTRVAVARANPAAPEAEKRFSVDNVLNQLEDESENFITENAWGYRTILIADVNNVLPGVNLRPIISFQHDVSGNSYRTGSFAEGRKSHTLALQATYYDLEGSISVTEFYGDGQGNTVRDRDHASVSVKYSF